jgi:hypothetical protein
MASGKQVVVTVSTAENLPDCSWFGSMDPYVVAYTLPGRKHVRQTKPHKDGYNKSFNVKPEWNEDLGNTMTLPIEEDSALVLEVWDENMFFDTLVGKTETSLDPTEFVHTALSTSGSLVYQFKLLDGTKKEGVWETALGESPTKATPAPPSSVATAVASTVTEAEAAASTSPLEAVTPVQAEEAAPEAKAKVEVAAPQVVEAAEVETPAGEVAEVEAETAPVASDADATGADAPYTENSAAEAPVQEAVVAEKSGTGEIADSTTADGDAVGLDYSTIDQEVQRAANRKRILNKKGGRGRGRGRGKK